MANDDGRKLATLQGVAKRETERKKDAPRKKDDSVAADKKKKVGDELSEEDKKIKENMELLVERMQDPHPGVAALALQTLSMELKAATSSMTSVPKPLKFLRPHNPVLVEHYKKLSLTDAIKEDYAMVLAVLCTTCGDGKRRSLYFCLEGSVCFSSIDVLCPGARKANCKDLTSWGFEFLRNLAGEVAAAYAELQGGGEEQRSSPEEEAADGREEEEKQQEKDGGEKAGGQQRLRREKEKQKAKKQKKDEQQQEQQPQAKKDGAKADGEEAQQADKEATMEDAAAADEEGEKLGTAKHEGSFGGEGERIHSKKQDEAESSSSGSGVPGVGKGGAGGGEGETAGGSSGSSTSVGGGAAEKERERAFRAWTPPLPSVEDLNKVVDLIIPYYMAHNAEIEGVDLLAEVDRVEALVQYMDSSNYQKVTAYVLSMAQFAGSTDEFLRLLKVTFEVLLRQQEYYDAMRVALKIAAAAPAATGGAGLGEENRVQQVLRCCSNNKLLVKQLALLLARQRYDCDFPDNEQAQRLNNGEELSKYFLQLAKETDVLEPKTPDEVYKVHLEDPPSGALSLPSASRRGGGATVGGAAAAATVGTAGTAATAAAASPLLDSAKKNLASTFVNAFVNAGFCKDKLMLTEGGAWLYKNKDHGMISAAASLGALLLWNVEEGLYHLDKYQYSSDSNIKAGALLGFGVLSSNVRHECDVAAALLKEHLEDLLEAVGVPPSSTMPQKLAAAIGLGCAYAGSKRQDVMEVLTVLVVDGTLPIELSAFAAASLGLIFVGSCNQEAAEAILTTLIDRSAVEKGLESPLCVYFALGLGLLFIGSRDACEPTLTALEALPSSAAAAWSGSSGNLSSRSSSSSEAKKQKQQLLSARVLSLHAQRIVEGMAFAGSGDVLKVQKFLSICAETRDKKYWADLCAKSSGGGDAEAGKATAAGGGESSAAAAVGQGGTAGGGSTNDVSKRRSNSNGGDGGGDETGNNSSDAGGGEMMNGVDTAAVGGVGESLDDEAGDAEDDDDEEEGSKKLDQAAAVMSVALLSFAEDVGAEMTLRVLEHILQYGELPQRRAVPLALALHSPSRAKPGVIDTLSKLSHDIDADVALNAIFAMGIVGAGTNNARIAGLLRSLASYYGKDTNALFVIRLAQGLLYMGKGLLTINPLHSDRFLINNVSLGCLCLIIHTCMHMRHTILGRFHYLLYYLFPAMHPRMLFTVAPKSLLPLPAAAAAAAEAQSSSTSSKAQETSAGSEGDETKGKEEKEQQQQQDGGEDVSMEAAEPKNEEEDKEKKLGTRMQEENKEPEAVVEEDEKLGEEPLEMICIPARVGEAVDIVGQVGRQPKTITAFQTHTTPVLLGYSERAELATDEYVPLATVLEGVVILKKNPNFKPPKPS